MRRSRRVVLRISGAFVAGATTILAFGGLAAAEPGFAPVQTMPAAANAASCPSAATCTAVGGSNVDNPFVLTETSDTWGSSTPIALPAGGLGGELAAVTCPSVSNCLAAGSFIASGGGTQPLLASETSGTWGTARTVPIPDNALGGSAEHAQFTSVWCAVGGNCVAIGSYQISGYTGLPMTAVEVGGIWSTAVALPAVNGGTGFFYRTEPSIACTSTGNCTAVDGSDAWSQSAGIWGMPVQLTAEPFFTAHGIACPSATTCIAVGDWTDADPPDALSIVETNGTWGPMNQRWFGDISSLSSISCQTDTCVAVGYADSDSDWDPQTYGYGTATTWSNGSWSSQRLTSTVFDGVSCASPTQCLAIGKGVSSALAPVGPVVAPFAPGVASTPVLHGATVSFQYPYDDGGAPVVSYSATAHPGGASCTTAARTCEITGLINGRQYVVTATDDNGTAASQRAFSNHFFAGVAPTSPSHLRVAPTKNAATLSWRPSTSPAGEPVLRYVVAVRSSGHEVRSFGTKSSSCNVTGLLSGHRYLIYVTAIDATGTSSPSVIRLALR